ncbi:hypothetical protein N665_2427s0001 [Sinapis alba]|nr:hypothetical protein N665_2427s0001 [Sinapis alba]
MSIIWILMFKYGFVSSSSPWARYGSASTAIKSSTTNSLSVFDAQANYLNQKLLAVDMDPKVTPPPEITPSSWEVSFS